MCMETVFALAFVITSTVLSPCSGQLTEIDNGCTCPGDVLTYECTVIGAGFTIWQGTAFHCPSVDSRIELRHSLYSSGTEKSCNEGAIVAHSVGVSSTDTGEKSYMSRLTVNLTSGSDLNGTTVECVYRRSSDGVETIVGQNTVRVTGAPPPPTGVVLLTAHPQELVFEWTPIESNCSSLEYGILSDCGTCANKSVTTQTTETCSIVQSLNTAKVCSFTVWTIVCESIYGMASAPVNVTLKVPQAPVSNVIPIYNETGNKLMEFEIRFTKVGSFLISNGIDGSAVNYTISLYIDVDTDNACETLTLSESVFTSDICNGRDCTIQLSSPCFRITSGTDPGLMKIAISATNVLGTGPATIFTLGAINSYVNVQFKSENIINCVFVVPQERSFLTCDIVYGICQLTPNLKAEGILISSDTVTIELPVNVLSTIHCYTINASNGTFTVLVRGTLISGKIKVGLPVIKPLQLTYGVFLFGNFVALMILIFIGWRAIRGDDPKIPQHVEAHIIFDLLDKPKKLLEALKSLRGDRNSDTYTKTSIKSIIIGHIVPDRSKVKIYIECDNNLSNDEERKIRTNMTDFVINSSLEIYKTPVRRRVPFNTTNEVPKDIVNCTFPEKAVNTPGLLYSVLKVVYKIRKCERIIVSDVIITPTKKGKRSIVIKSADLATIRWDEEA